MTTRATIRYQSRHGRGSRLHLCLIMAFVVVPPLWAADGQSRLQPNILVIMSDEHNAGVLGCYGNTIVRTPNLDGLARRGILFRTAYTNSPLCVPARLSFTSGKYVSRVGAWNNQCWLPRDTPSIARIMNDAGYESYLCGKMHYDKTCRYGFTEIGPGKANNAFMVGKGGRRSADALALPEGLSDRFKEFYPADDSSKMKQDREVTEFTVDFLSRRGSRAKPFFLVVGYISPHFPLIAPEEYWKPYERKVPMPVIPEGYLDTLPLNYKSLRVGFQMVDVPPETVRKGRELYYALTTWADNQIGKVLQALDQAGLRDDTVIIYTTDHGENMGEHGLWWKNCVFEHAAHIPLIISWPKRFQGGQQRTGACSLVDVVRTIAELGGAKVPKDWNGDSMVGWMDNAKTKWKDLAVSEYYAHNIVSGFAMVRQGRYKYVYHTRPDAKHDSERELYDLQTDPGEFNNLAKNADQKTRIEQMHALLAKELGEDPETTEQRCRADYAKGYGRPEPPQKKNRQARARASSPRRE